MGERLEQAPRVTDTNRNTAGRGKPRPAFALGALLSAPLAWLLVVYIGSLALLVVSSFFKLDDFTGKPTTELTTGNLSEAFTQSEYLSLVLRSVGVAVAATLICFLLAMPTAFYIARLASRRTRRGLIVALILPLWTGYLVKAFALRAVLEPGSEYGKGGLMKNLIGWSPGFGYTAVILTLAYLWFPYMLLPIYAGLERLPNSLLDASADLGAGSLRTFRLVMLPLLIPSIAAGSIFTFSLSLGDYITVKIVGGTAQLIGNIIERALLAPNQPLAAAFTLWPMLIMVVYLVVMGRAGAFKNL
jgi:putative spermidine/putrescine transport system permease protein